MIKRINEFIEESRRTRNFEWRWKICFNYVNVIWFRKISMISIFSKSVLSFENEIDVETFKLSKSSFNWFDDKMTRRCRDWLIEILKTIDEKSFWERTSAIWRDTNTLTLFNWVSRTSRNLSMTMIFVDIEKIIDDVCWIERMLSMRTNLLIWFFCYFDDFLWSSQYTLNIHLILLLQSIIW